MANHIVGTLSPKMTLREFENGYWYVDQLKDFGCQIGIPGATKLRKDELERAIVTFLRTGSAQLPTKRFAQDRHQGSRTRAQSEPPDSALHKQSTNERFHS